MKNAFIIAVSLLAVSAAGGEVKNRAVAQTEEKTTTPVKERVGSLFQSVVGDGISYRLAPQIRTEAGAILAAGADLHAKANDGATPLPWAVFNNHKDVAELLRQHGG